MASPIPETGRLQALQQLFHSRKLSQQYPIAKRYALKSNLSGLLGIVICTAIGAALLFFGTPMDSWAFLAAVIAGGVLTGIVLVRSLYLLGWCFTFSMELCNGNFHVSRGVFMKERSSFPLSRIVDIVVTYDIPDLILGLRTLRITPMGVGVSDIITISGVRSAQALQLKSELEWLSTASRLVEGNALPFPGAQTVSRPRVERRKPQDGFAIRMESRYVQ
jgi:uncharacterized membrane protein YdbT with pleckstrin-like domain